MQCKRALLVCRGSTIRTLARAESTTAKRFQDIPGPKPLPLLGNRWRFYPVIGEFHKLSLTDIQNKLFNKYSRGEKVAKLSDLPGRKDMVFLFDPGDVQKAYRNEGPWPIKDVFQSLNYYRNEHRKEFFKGVAGIAFTQGQQWQHFRSKVSQPMLRPRLAKLYVGAVDPVAEEMLTWIRELRDEQGKLPADFHKYLYRWALESIATISMDTRLGCLKRDLSPDSEPMKLIRVVQTIFRCSYELDLKPKMRHFTKYKAWDELVQAHDILVEIAMKYIRHSMDRMKTRSPNEDRELSVLERLLVTNEDPMVACVMSIDTLLSGFDTTCNSTAVLLHYLATNQDKQEILFQEISKVMPTKDEPVTGEGLDNMRYLKACIKESMRITPISDANMRESVQDMVMKGYNIPKGTELILCHMHMSNQQDQFPDPRRFLPERWLKGVPEEQQAHGFSYMPFGFGPRMCVGRRFAELEMATLTAKIIRNFRMEYNRELKTRPGIVNEVVSPMDIKLEERP